MCALCTHAKYLQNALREQSTTSNWRTTKKAIARSFVIHNSSFDKGKKEKLLLLLKRRIEWKKVSDKAIKFVLQISKLRKITESEIRAVYISALPRKKRCHLDSWNNNEKSLSRARKNFVSLKLKKKRKLYFQNIKFHSIFIRSFFSSTSFSGRCKT